MVEITSVCLSCLEKENVLNIYDTHECEGIEEIYIEMLKSCFDVTIPKVSGVRSMCIKCVHKLRNAHYFKQNMVTNLKVLLENVADYLDDESSSYSQASEDTDDTWYLIVKEDNHTEKQTLIQPNRVNNVGTKLKSVKENVISEKGDKKQAGNSKNTENNVIEKDVKLSKRKSALGKVQKKPKPSNLPPFSLAPGQTQCSVCEESFQTTKTLTEHMNVHYPNYVCSECGKQCACKVRLARHMKTHEDGSFPCHICGQIFKKYYSRTAHIWRVHQTKEPYVCSHCGERFTTFHKRLSHLQKAHAQTAEYPCPYCDNKYFYAGSRSQHIRSTHMRVRNHKCEHCKMAFFKRRALLSHMASVHGIGEKQHKCTICDKSFYRSSTLKIHMKRHTDKAFSCNACDAQFTYEAVFKAHMKSHQIRTENVEQTVVEDEVLEVDTVYFEVNQGVKEM